MAENSASPLLIALGDSITAGVGGKWNKGYPEHLLSLLQPQFPDLKLVNWGIPGLTVPRMTKALKKGEHLHEDLTKATCIVMTIGGNDIINAFKKNKKNLSLPQKQIEALNEDLDHLLQTLRTITTCPLFLGDLYNPFPESAEAGVILATVNEACLYPLPSKHPGLHIVRVSEALRGQEADHIQYYDSGTVRDLKKFWRTPIHPNDQGHLKMAQSFYQAMIAHAPFAKPPVKQAASARTRPSSKKRSGTKRSKSNQPTKTKSGVWRPK